MRLEDYLERHHLSGTEFAKIVGVDDATINRLIPREGKKQVRKPGWELISKIAKATNGQVTANDFMDDPADGGEGDDPAGGGGEDRASLPAGKQEGRALGAAAA